MPSDQHSIAKGVVDRARGDLKDFQESFPLEAITIIVSLLRTSLANRPRSIAKQFTTFTTLAIVLHARFHHSHDNSDLDQAILYLQSALDCCKSDQRSTTLYQLRAMLAARYDATKNVVDLKRAFSPLAKMDTGMRYRPTPDDVLFRNVAVQHLNEFKKSDNIEYLNLAIGLFREASTQFPAGSEDHAAILHYLSSTLHTRFAIKKQDGDRDEAILWHKEYLELRPAVDPDQFNFLADLSGLLWKRFDQKGQPSDRNEAILLQQEALKLRPPLRPNRSSYFSNVTDQPLTQQERVQRCETGNMDQGIGLRPSGIPPRADTDQPDLDKLANSLWKQFEQDGQQSNQDEAISLYRQSLKIQASSNPDQSVSLNNLANALLSRFEKGGQKGDLDEAILFHRQVLDLRAPTHPLRSTSLNNLANALSTRFHQEGRISDLNEAVSLHREALELDPEHHPHRADSLNNLANVLWKRFEQAGQQHSDLDEAISLHRQALELRPSAHPNHSASLNNLANALSTRFEQEGSRSDLIEANSLYSKVVKLRLPPGHHDKSIPFNNLASLRHAQFEQRIEGPSMAIFLYKRVLGLRPSPHPDRSRTFENLAEVLIRAQSSWANNAPDNLDQAMSAFSDSTKCLSQSASQRLRVAKKWTHHADLYQHPTAIEAYDAALQALPQLAAFNLDIQSRQQALAADSDGLARRAARSAIRVARLDKAIEYLEAGRAVFWSQLLQLRSPFDRLHDIAPEFEAKLRSIATELESKSHEGKFIKISDNRAKMTQEAEESHLDSLNKEWARVLSDVRELKGFEDFLRPLRLSSLQAAAAKIPVVFLVDNDDGSHCLIMSSASVHHIPLPRLTTEELRKLVYLIQAAALQAKISRSSIGETAENVAPFPPPVAETLRSWMDQEESRGMRYANQIPSDSIFKSVLETIWIEVVQPVIDFLGLEKSDQPPVLQWCPTGLFAFLPIHAAGSYNEGDIDCVSDYVVSSYTPTIGVLLEGDNPNAASSQDFEMMAVVDTSRLPSARSELENIRRRVPNDCLVQLGIPGVPAQVEAIISHLSTASIVHFACHGKQNRSKPLDSALVVEDGEIIISRIIQQPLPNGSLAFLCACETAMGDENLPDEAMSLGACLLFSGFSRVVATMWEIKDKDGPTITDAFYEELFRGPDGQPTSRPDVNKSAMALHSAVKKLRSNDVPFRRWVPFIHMGK
ncbi:CHAT domain-containing protein [Crassisporium funariophilum]|nr:CHAT domain-containing protein [Crassisporium funariophilum]